MSHPRGAMDWHVIYVVALPGQTHLLILKDQSIPTLCRRGPNLKAMGATIQSKKTF